jgi:hypothetical protein
MIPVYVDTDAKTGWNSAEELHGYSAYESITTIRKATSMRNFGVLITAIALPVMSACSNPQPQTGAKASAPAAQVHGSLLQVMRGILFPNSNVVFAVQGKNPADIKPVGDPSTATDPLQGSYGGWTAVENSGIALAEAANLLTIPGRKCANGRDVPLNDPDWPKFVQGLRDAGMKAYQAGQSKSEDKVLEAADAMTTACSNCHDKWRDKPGGDAARCM